MTKEELGLRKVLVRGPGAKTEMNISVPGRQAIRNNIGRSNFFSFTLVK